LIGVAPVVCRSAVQPEVVELNLANVQDMKFLNHQDPLTFTVLDRGSLAVNEKPSGFYGERRYVHGNRQAHVA
jgi:hypothetical protein